MISRISPDFIEELRNEIAILKTLDHPNIVKLFETFEDKKHMHLVLELCAGGDLYQHLKSRGLLRPYEALPGCITV